MTSLLLFSGQGSNWNIITKSLIFFLSGIGILYLFLVAKFVKNYLLQTCFYYIIRIFWKRICLASVLMHYFKDFFFLQINSVHRCRAHVLIIAIQKTGEKFRRDIAYQHGKITNCRQLWHVQRETTIYFFPFLRFCIHCCFFGKQSHT